MAVARAVAFADLVAAVASAFIEVCADRVGEEAVAVIASACASTVRSKRPLRSSSL
jgi:hypothetical protein